MEQVTQEGDPVSLQSNLESDILHRTYLPVFWRHVLQDSLGRMHTS